ncbi:MAG: flagellar protein FhlB [Sedimenticola sp.]|jgi:flagellar biosynthesis protein|nr:MAG: flagellar protein FhlB [Sedimenticola sp.]
MSKTYTQAPDVAVALLYDGNNAPRITAKGRGAVAERIFAIAENHGIPLENDPELAAILAQIPLGDEIPENLYRAIAEIIAFAYMLSGRTPPGYKK